MCKMQLTKLSKLLQEHTAHWHKLIFILEKNYDNYQIDKLKMSFEVLNINLLLSEKLLTISSKNYPLYVEEEVRNLLKDKKHVYIFHHIDILFDPLLRINPVRLLENISKQYQLIVVWPGDYIKEKLIYAKQGHPEHFKCEDFEGEVIN